jgi:hypothetical protein
MSNVVQLRPHAPRPATDDTIRADCERLMRRLVKSRCAYEHELRDLADLLDVMIERVERER